ncbi:MAG: DNA (cytosine-5-)-methyltransferase [Oscillospiraceae bacterium]|nr:DNA (cytosine-5-)-methyltransferase [Oscillospiraceae bacterium]
MIRVFDAFSGIGGFRSGLERAGNFSFVGWCEIDKFAQKAYRTLYDVGGEDFYENIRTIDARGLADFDLLTGGFPCQPFSVAGKRRGIADERGDLFFALARILEAKRPRYFILENVPGLLGIEKGRTFAKILGTLSELGYCVEWLVHNSAGFGVPQSRKRVYLAGCLGTDCSGQILAFGKVDEKNSRKVRQLIGGSQGQRVYETDGLAVTQCSGSGGMGGKTGLYFIGMEYPSGAVFCDLNENPQITDTARCIHTRYDLGVSSGTHRGERSGILVEDAPRAILNPEKVTVRQNGRRIKEPNEPMFTLTVTDRHGIVHHGRIRRLVPIECWRLQGFRTEQFQKVAETGMSDAQLYKQAGNAVTVNVVETLAKNLLRFDERLQNKNISKNMGVNGCRTM